MIATNDLLQQGIAAARSGQRGQARALLVRAVQIDQRNEYAWLWLAGVVDDPADARRCLQQVLQINPGNRQARQGLVWIEQRQVAPTAPHHAPVTATTAGNPEAAAAHKPANARPEPATAPRRGFGTWFNRSEPDRKPDAGMHTADTSATAAPRRGFGAWFKKPAAAPPAPADQVTPPAPANQASAKPAATTAESAPVRGFGAWFSKPGPAQTAVAAAVVAGAATATPAAAPARPGPRRKEKELPPEPGDPARDCCPYCGELNKPERQWCRRCDQSLMIRGPAREERSPWLTILGIFWIIGGALGILGSLAVLVLALLAFATVAPNSMAQFPLVIVLVVVIALLLSGGQIAVARAMLNRARWAYWIIAMLTMLQLAGSLLGIVTGAATLRESIAQMQATMPAPQVQAAIPLITGMFGTIIFVDVAIKALFALLVALSWRDFYGPMERFVSEIQGKDDRDYFNIGVALKSKKMWWMAMRQWEAAVARSSRDVEYLHALALAYAQLGKLEQARSTIEKAVQLEPQNPALQQSHERIIRLATA